MDGFLKIMENLADFDELAGAVKQNISPVTVTGVSDSMRAHLAFCVCKKFDRPAVVVAQNEAAAKRIYEDLTFFLGGDVLLFTETDLLFYDVEAKGHDVRKLRLGVLDKLMQTKGRSHLVTTIQALLSVTVPKEVYDHTAITLSVGDDLELNELEARLSALGYKREELVEGAGQFSIRGGILDFYPYYSDAAYRVEFFDTEVDSIRLFDPENQRTIEMAESARITPARELVLDEVSREKLVKTLNRLIKTAGSETPEAQKLTDGLKRDAERLEQGIYFPSIDKYIPLIYKEKPTILDYISPEAVIFWDEPSRISEYYRGEQARFGADLVDMAERGIIADAAGEYALPMKTAVSRLTKHHLIGLSAISHPSSDFRPKLTVALNAKTISSFQGRMEYLYDALRFYIKEKYRVVILGGSEIRAKNLIRQLEEEGFSCEYDTELEDLPQPGVIAVTHGSINRGFEYPLIRTVVIGDREIFGGERKKPKRFGKRQGDKIENFTDLNVGDFVVHQNYGIGQYIGIEQLAVDGARKDYLKISYKDSDFLYVPTDQLDMVYKHIAKDGAHVRVNKLGGGEWSKTKQRVKAAAADMAKELIALYAQRSQIPGIGFSKDTEWQRDFEATFPYEETEDQLRSIEEVKADMEKPHPMDRLLCGDVGYGKTEVAIRAAFKAVTDGYQVAYLVPTTILASQHFNTFRQRMKGYPINIGMLSRFCTAAQQKEILKGLNNGEVDIVIGTHKLLGKAVKFHKLGLLIIDEEQRFGVGHKEKIKELRKEVDVLTLSATPIPRTLHMSLTGIRDMSVINQPPSERFPVATYVMEYNEDVIRDAVNKEMGRGGQVYYLFNRVEGIYKAANRIAELVPDARVAVAHGKMHESELEQIMMELSEGEVDVLVCTTIIETGLDIPNVNTIIIEDSDRLGLAQLYQLRGRVGRSNRLAYAYLTFRRNKVLTEEAEKRLLAIKEFTEFGSGFKIAMRDLEIRGTGNLIGSQQHGHMEAVGYEMYCRLLEEAVREQQGLAQPRKTESLIDLPVSAYIPETYITSHSQRISAYKRIASIADQDELFDVYDEMEDRYGPVPNVVGNLMEISLIKTWAENFGVKEMIGRSDQILFQFDEENIPDMQKCMDLIAERPGEFYVSNPERPRLHYKIKREKGDAIGTQYLKAVKETMQKLA